MSQRIQALKLRIATLQAELATCTTSAMCQSVMGSLNDARQQLEAVKQEKVWAFVVQGQP
jgi:hypothetical protein